MAYHHSAYHAAHAMPQRFWAPIVIMFFILLGVLYFWGHENYGLFDVDEAIFTQATVEMIEDNNYVTPIYNGEPRYHKPPLIYWLQAVSLNAMDAVPYKDKITPLAARLSSAICGFLAVFSLFMFTQILTQRSRIAFTAAAVFGLSLSWFVIVRAATADAAMNLLIITNTMYCLWVLYKGKSSFWLQAIAGVLLGLGLLAKGPVVGFVPFVVVGTAVLFKPGFFNNLRVLNPFIILCATLCTVAPWGLMIIQSSGLDFFKEFIFVHNIGRFADGMNNTHSGSPFYYITVLFIGFFPWSFLLLAAVPWVMDDVYTKLRSKHSREVLPVLGFIWCVSVVVLFSFSNTKLPHYIVPALPGAALVIAGWVDELSLRPFRKIAILGVFVAVLLGFVFMMLNPLLVSAQTGELTGTIMVLQGLFGFEWPLTDQLLADILKQPIPINIVPVVIGILFILGGTMGIPLIIQGFRAGVSFMLGIQYAILSLIIVGIVPTVDLYMQKPLVELAVHIKQIINDDMANGSIANEITVYHLGLHQPSVRLVSGIPFIEVSIPAQLEGKLEDKRTIILHEAWRIKEVAEIFPNTAKIDTTCKGGFCVVVVDDQNTEQEEVKEEKDV